MLYKKFPVRKCYKPQDREKTARLACTPEATATTLSPGHHAGRTPPAGHTSRTARLGRNPARALARHPPSRVGSSSRAHCAPCRRGPLPCHPEWRRARLEATCSFPGHSQHLHVGFRCVLKRWRPHERHPTAPLPAGRGPLPLRVHEPSPARRLHPASPASRDTARTA